MQGPTPRDGTVMQFGPDNDWMCRAPLILTVYLPSSPTKDQALNAWRAYASVCPRDRMRLISDRRMPDFDELPIPPHESDIEPYMREMDRRLDQGVIVWDGGETSFWSFNIGGVFEPDQPPQASFCQIIFPDDAPPSLAIDAARGLADRLPLLSGHAGYTTLFKLLVKNQAFDQIYAWAKRYWGLEVEDLNRTLPVTLDGVKGANWLTLVGNDFWLRLQQAGGGAEVQVPSSVAMEVRAHARLLVAGDRPVFADRNRGEFPDAYAAVERAIQPIKVVNHPEFDGRFREEHATGAWLHRLTEPTGW